MYADFNDLPPTSDANSSSTNIDRHIAFHQVNVVATGSQAKIPPAMLAIERERSRVCGTDAQLGSLNSMSTHEIHCVVLKFAADARTAHFLDQIKEVHISASWGLKDLHLHLSDDLVAVPGVDVSIRELGSAQPKPFDVVDAVKPGLHEEVVIAKTADERVTTKRHAHLRMRVEIDRFENESFWIHSIMCLTVCGNCHRLYRTAYP